MYDQLAVLSPVMLALTAATPILKGRLVDTDVRWDTIATSVDDRTPAERGLLDADPVRTFGFGVSWRQEISSASFANALFFLVASAAAPNCFVKKRSICSSFRFVLDRNEAKS